LPLISENLGFRQLHVQRQTFPQEKQRIGMIIVLLLPPSTQALGQQKSFHSDGELVVQGFILSQFIQLAPVFWRKSLESRGMQHHDDRLLDSPHDSIGGSDMYEDGEDGAADAVEYEPSEDDAVIQSEPDHLGSTSQLGGLTRSSSVADEQLRATLARVHEYAHLVRDLKTQLAAKEKELSVKCNAEELERLQQERTVMLEYMQETVKSTTRLQAEKDALEQRVHTVEKQLEEARQRAESCADLQKTVDEANNTRASLATELNRVSAQFKELEQKYDVKVQEANEMAAIQGELLNAIRDANQANQELQSDLYLARDSLTDMQRTSDMQKSVIEKLQNELEQMNQMQQLERQQFQQELHASNTVASQHAASLSSHEQAMQEAKATVAELQLQLQDMQQQVNAAKEQQTKAEDESAKLRNDLSETIETLRDLTQRLHNTQKDLEECGYTGASLEEKLKQIEMERVLERKLLHDEIHSLRSQRDRLQAIADEKSQIAEEMQNKLVTVTSDKTTETTRLHQELDSALHRSSALASELAEKNKQLEQCQKEMLSQSQDLSQIRLEFDDLQVQHMHSISEVCLYFSVTFIF